MRTPALGVALLVCAEACGGRAAVAPAAPGAPASDASAGPSSPEDATTGAGEDACREGRQEIHQRRNIAPAVRANGSVAPALGRTVRGHRVGSDVRHAAVPGARTRGPQPPRQ